MSARSVSVWYTVRSEMPGISSLATAYSASAVGWLRVAVRATRNSSWRCGVTFSPWARNAPVSSVGDFTQTHRMRMDCSFAIRADWDLRPLSTTVAIS